MRKLEEVDPELIDQAVGRVCRLAKGDPSREIAIATHLSMSAELVEWVEMIYNEPPPSPDPVVARKAMLFSAVSIGLEVGYELGALEKARELPIRIPPTR